MQRLLSISLPLFGVGTLLASCVTTHEVSHAESVGGTVITAGTSEAYLVRDAGRVIGAVVRYEEGLSGRFLYNVRDRYGLDLGLVDAEGKAWRFRPHSEPEWLHTGTVSEGIARILGSEGEPRLEGVEPQALPGLMKRPVGR